MDKESIKIILTQVFHEVFEDSTIVISENLTANEVENWDSISNVMMIDRVEKEFNIKLKLKEVVSMQNVGDLINAISTKVE